MTINVLQSDENDSPDYPYHINMIIEIRDNYVTQGCSYSGVYLGCYQYMCDKKMNINISNYWGSNELVTVYYKTDEMDPPDGYFSISNQYDVNSIQKIVLPYIESMRTNKSDEDDGTVPLEVNIDLNKLEFLNCNDTVRLDFGWA